MNTRSHGLQAIPVALIMLSCGNAASPPAEGALNMTISHSSNAPVGHGCPGTASVALGAEAPGPTSPGVTWIDGQDGHTISCVVSGSGTYKFNASIDSSLGTFAIDGTVDSGASGTGAVSVFEPNLRIGLRDDNCTIQAGGSYRVEKGAIWAGFECKSLTSNDDDYAWCRTTGTFVFKSCDD